MGQVTWSEDAERWLREIYEYISEDSVDSAQQTIEGIRGRVRYLATFPELGGRLWRSSRNVRVILYGHYRIAYLVHEDYDVIILGVFHGSMDINRFKL